MPECTTCGYAHDDENIVMGHIRNIHGWKTNCGCTSNAQCATHATPTRCGYALPGLGRCWDTSGVAHGHHFRPGHLDPSLVLTDDEAREIVGYMQHQYINKNLKPLLHAVISRLADRV